MVEHVQLQASSFEIMFNRQHYLLFQNSFEKCFRSETFAEFYKEGIGSSSDSDQIFSPGTN